MITGDIGVVIMGGSFPERKGPVHRKASVPVSGLNMPVVLGHDYCDCERGGVSFGYVTCHNG